MDNNDLASNVSIYMKKKCFVLRRCKMRSDCVIQVSSDLFAEDPCPGTHKYLEVQYRCMAKAINQSYTYILGLSHFKVNYDFANKQSSRPL